MFSRLEEKLMGVKKVKIQGVVFKIKKITPEDYLDKEGLPISKWQIEAEAISTKQRENSVSLNELKIIWKRIFIKAIISINKNYNVEDLVDKIVDNYFLSAELYKFIGEYSFGVKKKLFWFLKPAL